MEDHPVEYDNKDNKDEMVVRVIDCSNLSYKALYKKGHEQRRFAALRDLAPTFDLNDTMQRSNLV